MTKHKQDEDDLEAQARISRTQLASGAQAKASGRGSAAAASLGAAVATGSTVAAAGESSALAEASDEDVLAVQRDLGGFVGELRDAVLSCLSAIQRSGVQQDRIKETVDEVWAIHAAAAVRAGSPLERAAKDVLLAAAKLGAGGVAKLLLPKVLA